MASAYIYDVFYVECRLPCVTAHLSVCFVAAAPFSQRVVARVGRRAITRIHGAVVGPNSYMARIAPGLSAPRRCSRAQQACGATPRNKVVYCTSACRTRARRRGADGEPKCRSRNTSMRSVQRCESTIGLVRQATSKRRHAARGSQRQHMPNAPLETRECRVWRILHGISPALFASSLAQEHI